MSDGLSLSTPLSCMWDLPIMLKYAGEAGDAHVAGDTAVHLQYICRYKYPSTDMLVDNNTYPSIIDANLRKYMYCGSVGGRQHALAYRLPFAITTQRPPTITHLARQGTLHAKVHKSSFPLLHFSH